MKKKPAETAGLLTMDEAIDLLKTTRPTFYRWLRSGKLRGTKVGRQWRFTREDVDRFLKGDEVRIDLPADIDPLISALERRLAGLGVNVGAAEAGASKVSRAVELMIRLARAMHASDLHLDAHEGGAKVRLRVDGALHLVTTFDLRLLPAVVERWKILAAMDVREKAMPQDGRILMEADGKPLDLRVCCVPAYLGESLVARILSTQDVMLDLDRIPYSLADRARVDRWLAAPWGMVVITGPTGSGKTTTLYSCLAKLAGVEQKVVSIEDPVEYLMAGVTQIKVNHKNGLSFESILRAVFRTDPDVVMVGEIRNLDTLQLCFQAALTGHLLLSTLHTDEAAGALRRMLDIGAPPFLVADAVKLIVGQRLVRRLCPHCAAALELSREQMAKVQRLASAGGMSVESLGRDFRRPVGCAACGNLGFRGRTLIAEAMEMSPELVAAVRENQPLKELRAIAIRQGMTTMGADGVRRASSGEVFFQEVLNIVAGIDY